MTALKLAAAFAVVLVSCQAALAQPVPIDKRHAYEGPRRTAGQIATVYGKIVTNLGSLSRPLTMTMIHNVNGKAYAGRSNPPAARSSMCCPAGIRSWFTTRSGVGMGPER